MRSLNLTALVAILLLVLLSACEEVVNVTAPPPDELLCSPLTLRVALLGGTVSVVVVNFSPEVDEFGDLIEAELFIDGVSLGTIRNNTAVPVAQPGLHTFQLRWQGCFSNPANVLTG